MIILKELKITILDVNQTRLYLDGSALSILKVKRRWVGKQRCKIYCIKYKIL